MLIPIFFFLEIDDICPECENQKENSLFYCMQRLKGESFNFVFIHKHGQNFRYGTKYSRMDLVKIVKKLFENLKRYGLLYQYNFLNVREEVSHECSPCNASQRQSVSFCLWGVWRMSDELLGEPIERRVATKINKWKFRDE